MEEAKELIVENQNPLEKVLFTRTSDIVRKKHCPVCASKVREQVDAMLEKGEPHHVVKKFLEDNGELVTLPKIKYHYNAHVRNAESDSELGEYAASIGEMAAPVVRAMPVTPAAAERSSGATTAMV